MDLGPYLDAAQAFDHAFRGRWEPVAAAPAAEPDQGRLAAAWAVSPRCWCSVPRLTQALVAWVGCPLAMAAP